ncbi:hypothetical protein AGMMS49965_01100 [Bacteroidia bacterium]|nr:hypothetical protein AGMMS49965_01100 [Bacteroidia bacterium]
MKTVIYFFGIAMVLLAVSCTGMNDNIEEYLNRGEIDYLGRPGSAYTQSGFNRVRIAWFVNEDPRITASVITWNDRKNEPQSTSVPINRDALVNGFMSVILPLEEGTYVFKIEHTGNKGFTSIATEVSGSVLGANYIAALQPRSIDAVTVYQDRVEIDWAIADANVTKVLLTYETASGAKKTVEVAPSDGKTVLTGNKLQGEYSWLTKVLDAGALDEFDVQSGSKIFPLPNYPLSKTGWGTYAPHSSPQYGSGTGAIIDGNTTTFWCSPTTGTAPAEPYYIQVDMQNAKHVTNIQVDERYDIRQLEISSSLDGSDWQVLGTLSFEGGEHGVASLSFEEAKAMQHIRFTVTGSGDADGRGAIFEIDVTGYED